MDQYQAQLKRRLIASWGADALARLLNRELSMENEILFTKPCVV